MTILGSAKKKYVFLSEGVLGPLILVPVILNVIKAAGMTPAREYRIDSYPYFGKGGFGYTLYQPLCESYCLADVYYELNETEILLSTCKPERMNEEAIVEILEAELGETRRIL